MKRWLKKNTQDLQGKTLVVVGSTGGLGTNIVNILAQLNANLILMDRDISKSNELKQEILKLNNKIDVKNIKIDFSNLDSVNKALKKLEKIENIYGIIHTSGVYNVKFNPDENYNIVFKINFLYPFYFYNKLFPKLNNETKLVVIGSIAYKFAQFNKEDIDYSYNKSQNKIYGNSKRWLMIALSELSKEYPNVKYVITHPGITYTNITRNFPKIIKSVIKVPMRMVFNSPKHASLSIIKGLFEDTKSYEWIGPKHFDIWGNPATKEIKKLNDEECKCIYEYAKLMCAELDKNKNCTKIDLKEELCNK